jgi:hypothetical protein
MGGSLKAAGFGDGRECQKPAKHILKKKRLRTVIDLNLEKENSYGNS